MVEGESNGHKIYYDGKYWRFKDTNEICNHERVCSKCGKAQVVLEYNGKKFGVDACIAPIVQVLNDGGIKTIASCCGHHNPLLKSIILERGTVISILSFENYIKLIKKEKVDIYGEVR